MSLSDRIRPNSEAAPWVVEEVKQLERKNAALAAALQRYLDCDPAGETPGDTPAAQARAALALPNKPTKKETT